jgi:hypothetical protein
MAVAPGHDPVHLDRGSVRVHHRVEQNERNQDPERSTARLRHLDGENKRDAQEEPFGDLTDVDVPEAGEER